MSSEAVENENEETTEGVEVDSASPPQVAVAPVAAPVHLVQTSSDTHPLVNAAIQSGPLDPASLKELMALQRDWEAGEAKKEFTRAMVAMKQELPSVLNRDKSVDFTTKTGRTSYTHTSLAAAVEAVTPHMCKHGFSASFKTDVGDRNHVVVTCTLTHRDGHSESCALSGPPENSGTKNAVQAVASTVTLLERYTLLALLGIATKDHNDPQPSAQPAKTVDEIITMFREAKAPAHIRDAKKAWSDAKASITAEDRDELTLELEEAIKRVEEARNA